MSKAHGNKILEFFGKSTRDGKRLPSLELTKKQLCPFTETKCFKIRKSQADVSIGTCSLRYGKNKKDVIICPNRLLENNQVFIDCIHLLSLHEPGNQLHIIPEVSIPGGSVDFFLVSSLSQEVKDFVGIEFQTLDTTGTIWPERQRLLQLMGGAVSKKEIKSEKSFGMNWKMTAKTILIQLHHKVDTFEQINKHLVLVIQDHFHDYLKKEFRFDHLTRARLGDSTHIHSYELKEKSHSFHIELKNRLSTDATGIADCLGLKPETKVELTSIISTLESKISADTLLKL